MYCRVVHCAAMFFNVTIFSVADDSTLEPMAHELEFVIAMNHRSCMLHIFMCIYIYVYRCIYIYTYVRRNVLLPLDFSSKRIRKGRSLDGTSCSCHEFS